jgi:pyruvate/2-oxoglutarate dehydrogenase complex dihydrolipoamide acyltransferase (E2) component
MEIKVPEHVQHMNDIRLNHWYYEEGDEVLSGTRLCELYTEDGPVNIMADANGMLDEVFFHGGDPVSADDTIALVALN